MDPQALALNKIIEGKHPEILNMLSERGRNIFFPKQGILAQSAQAKGKKINATIGEAREDDGLPVHLEELEKLINLPAQDVYPYAPSFGKPEIRNHWMQLIYRKNPSLGNTLFSKPIATNGLTHGLSITGYLFADKDDSIVLSDLYWENYELIFSNAYGSDIKTFRLFNNGGFDVSSLGNTLDEVKSEKIILLLNFPNNPSGYTPLSDEAELITLEILRQAEKGKKVVVIIDDAYYGLVFEEDVFSESIFVKLANLHRNVLAIKLDGPTKEDYVWGFRVGFISYAVKEGDAALYEALEAKTAGAIRGNISNISHLSQSLLLKAYMSESYESTKAHKFEILKKRCRILKDCFTNTKYKEYFEPLPFNSGYFMCIEIKKGIDPEKVRLHLLEKYSTGVIVFGRVIRLAFSAVSEKKLPELVENIYLACRDIENK